MPMKQIARPSSRADMPQHQRGIALFVVIVFVLLSMLLALWASRSFMFSELVIGNDADYQRAVEAAESLLRDAELDIRGGSVPTAPGTETPHKLGLDSKGIRCYTLSSDGDICRRTTLDQIPLEAKDLKMLPFLKAQATHCRNGLCTKRVGRQDFWNYPTSSTSINPTANATLGEVPLADLAKPGIGARYGQYTGALKGNGSKPANPLLYWDSSTPADEGGWYWIEVLPYDDTSQYSNLIVGGNTNLLTLSLTPSVVYRITALAYGRKPGTLVVLQQTYAPQKLKD